MLIDPNTRLAFPEFSRFLEYLGRSAARTPRIVAGLEQHGEMTRSEVRAVLTTTAPPVVAVARTNENALATFDHGTRRIHLAPDLAARYENNPEERRTRRLQQTILAVLLHEIVHWGDARDGTMRGEVPAHALHRQIFGDSTFPRYW